MRLKNRIGWSVFILTLLYLKQPVVAQNSHPNKPNVIFIYTDDEGRGMLGFEGQKIIKTPNVDFMAKNGMVFQNDYGCMFCAPARASLLTGFSDVRKGKFITNRAGIYIDYLKGMLTLHEVDARLNKVEAVEHPGMVLSQVFDSAGYVTGEIGKLEWGFATSRKQMKDHGWDYYYGYLDHRMCHGFYPEVMFENGNPVRIPGNTRPDAFVDSNAFKHGPIYPEFAENLFMDKAREFIIKNRNHPFFLYFPTNLPHGPVSVPAIDPEFIHNDSLTWKQKMYASMIKMIDDNVGTFIKLIDSLGLSQNTIFIFGADNGHHLYYEGKKEHYDNITTAFSSANGGDIFNGNDGMAGLKTTNWDGGVLVPMVYYWPGGPIKPGTISYQLISNYDLLPTVADLLHVKIPDKKDGISYLPILEGKKMKGHNDVVYGSFMGPALVTRDGWKLRTYLLHGKNIFQLYYLPKDYAEEHDLRKQYPEKVDSLKRILLKKCNGNLRNGIYDFDTQPLTELNDIKRAEEEGLKTTN
ncbi:MAG: sulfatase-like hydrolase/transferase [Chitinophagaceae bacterium]